MGAKAADVCQDSALSLSNRMWDCGSVILLLWALLFQTLSDSLGCIRGSEVTQLVQGSTAATWTSRKDMGESGTNREGPAKVGGQPTLSVHLPCVFHMPC